MHCSLTVGSEMDTTSISGHKYYWSLVFEDQRLGYNTIVTYFKTQSRQHRCCRMH